MGRGRVAMSGAVSCAVVAGGLVASGLVAQPAVAASSFGTTIERWAGTGVDDPMIPGPSVSSPLTYPQYLASDRFGTVYVGFSEDSEESTSIAKITRAGVISFLTNSAVASGSPVPGPALASPFQTITGLAAAPDGTVYISDGDSGVVVKVAPSGTLSIVAGNGSTGTVVAGPATATPMEPGGLAVGPDGSLYIADIGRRVVSKVVNGTLSIVAGTGSGGTPVTGGPATSSPFRRIGGLAVDASGDLFIADTSEDCVTMRSATTGDLEPVAGTCGTMGGFTAGPAAASGMLLPAGLALDTDGDLYVADDGNRRIEKITDPDSGTGTIAAVAGNGSSGALVPGPAVDSPMGVEAVTVTRGRTLYIADGASYVFRIAAASGPSEAPLELTATGGNASATLSFLPPDDDGNTAVSGYQVSVDGGTWVTLTTSAASGGRLSGVVSGLTNGTSYSFRVRAVTQVTGAAASNAAQATPVAPSSGGSSWFRDVVPPAQRALEVAVPKSPRSYRGPRTFTRARNKAYTGQTAMPAPAIRGRALAAGQAAVLSGDGLFDFNSSVLTKDGRRQVRLLIPALRNAQRVVCEGYTDYGAELAWEYQLSRARAKRVCSALRAGGVDAVMVTSGYGPQRPVVIGGPRNKRAENRRVVVLVRR